MTLESETLKHRPARVTARHATWLTLVAIALGYFMVMLDSTALTVALPDLGRSLHAGGAGLQWAVDAYTLTFAGFLLAGGAAADRWGPRKVFQLSVGVLGLLSLACAAATGIGPLIALRALLGIAAAGVLPASLSLIAGAYSDPARRARAVGAWAAVSGCAMAFGPLAGGVLVQLAGWRAIFLVNPPLAALSAWLVGRLLAETSARSRRFDVPGLLLSLVFLLGLSWALVRVASAGWSSPDVIVALTGSALALGTLVMVERRASSPGLPPALFASPRLAAALAGGTAVNFALGGLLFVMTLALQGGKSLTPLEAGIAFLPLTLPTAFNPILTGRLVARFGPRPLVICGLLFTAACGAILAIAGTGATSVVLSLALLALGLGVSLSIPALTADVISAAPPGLTGTASAVLNAVRQAGSTLGVAVLGSQLLAGRVGVVIAALLLVAGAAYMIGTRRSRTG